MPHPVDPMNLPPNNCNAHSGLSVRVNLVITMLAVLIGLQGYAVNINTETRIKMAELSSEVSRIADRTVVMERRITALERDSQKFVQTLRE